MKNTIRKEGPDGNSAGHAMLCRQEEAHQIPPSLQGSDEVLTASPLLCEQQLHSTPRKTEDAAVSSIPDVLTAAGTGCAVLELHYLCVSAWVPLQTFWH